MSARDQSGSFFEFFHQLLPNLLDRKVSSAQFVILLFTTFSRCFMKMSSTDRNTDSCGIPLVKWMMYWIVFAFFTTAETLTDIVLSWAERCPVYGVFMAMDERLNDTRRRFPFYFELKIAFVIWLLSPYTKGSSVLYRKFVHPTLSNKEKEIDEYITQACDKSYETMMRVGKRGLNLAANAAVTAAAKGQGVLSEKLRSFSMQDLTLIRDEDAVPMRSRDPQLHPSGASLLETIEDSASCYSSGEESSVAHRSNGTPSDTRTDPSDEDAGDKLPKRTQSLKTPKKLPVRSVKARPKKKAAGSLTSGESS
ncbi:receptor expression-enhancing protein 2 isoform X2 [Vidua chalybeata]|uniref:receptor expression-enhancing protein 2 isoform X2 n=1 Tax=Vidua chalybeata TaxID=81927 RepID=UPI0023A7F5B7|nr:receptor expression-enhancing protein 2 isoform X2 [Vidua chalybeata]XP_053812959.1 receptor expression-enhancing protein 2 isoform X2 [Vidua chalybeata]